MHDLTSASSVSDPSGDRAWRVMWFIGLCALAATARTTSAQMPGTPVLQSAWAAPGFAVAANYGGGSGGSLFGVAGAWARATGRFQVSAGAGYQNRSDFDGRGVYGVRVAVPFGDPSGAIGLAAFAGVGGGPRGRRHVHVGVDTIVVIDDDVSSTAEVPVGASIGYRWAIGQTRGVSVYAVPAWVFYTGGADNTGLFRAAVGADVAITRAIGATIGVDFGGTRASELGGPSSAQVGLGVSYGFGR
jgi:hypothetical protein